MVIPRHETSMFNFKVNVYSFEKVEELEYSGLNENEKNITLSEIKLRISVANRSYYYTNKETLPIM